MNDHENKVMQSLQLVDLDREDDGDVEMFWRGHWGGQSTVLEVLMTELDPGTCTVTLGGYTEFLGNKTPAKGWKVIWEHLDLAIAGLVNTGE